MIAEQFESHSKMIDVIMEALEAETITDGEKANYEKAIDGALEYLSGSKWLIYRYEKLFFVWSLKIL